MNKTKKLSEKELTLAEILDAYDDIIRHDELNMSVTPPKIDPAIRQTVYLELLRYKKS